MKRILTILPNNMEQFDNNEIFDDFKPAEESAAFVNETIGNVIERELTEVELFKEDFDEQLLMADNPKDNLTQIIVGYIQGCGDVNQVNICSYKSKNGVALDGWGFNPIILNQLYRRRYSYLCRFPLILNVYMNWLMIIGVKEKSNPKYKQYCRHFLISLFIFANLLFFF